MPDAAALRYRTESFRRSVELREAFGGGLGRFDERKHPRSRDGKFTSGMGKAYGAAKKGLHDYGVYRKREMARGNRVGLASTALGSAGGALGSVLGAAGGLAAGGPIGAFAGGSFGAGTGAKFGTAVGKRLDKFLPGITGTEAMAIGMLSSAATGRILSKSGLSQRLFMRSAHAGKKFRSGGEAYAARVLQSRLTPAQRVRVMKRMGPWLTAAKSARKDMNSMYRMGYKVQRAPGRMAKKAFRSAGRALKGAMKT